MIDDALARHDRALELAEDLVSGVPVDGWDGPTPCAEWTVRQLVEHLAWGNTVLAAALGGAPYVEPGNGRRMPLPSPPDLAYSATVVLVRELLGRAACLDRPLDFPGGALPAATALEIRVQDIVVHCWDLAVATCQPLLVADDLVRSAERTVAARVAAGTLPHDQFAQPRRPSGRRSDLGTLLAAVGREEGWAAPAPSDREDDGEHHGRPAAGG